MSPLVSQVTVKRVGDVMFRYIEFFEQYPCLRLETFTDNSFKRIDGLELCKFPVDGALIDVTKAQLSGVVHENLRLEQGVFYFSTDIIFARSGYRYLNCSVVISSAGKLSPAKCAEGERPPTPQAK